MSPLDNIPLFVSTREIKKILLDIEKILESDCANKAQVIEWILEQYPNVS